MWFHRHQLFQIFSYSVTSLWICLFCHQLLQNLVGLVLGLCLHFVSNVKARSAVDFIHFGFCAYIHLGFFSTCLESEQCEISRLIVCNIHTTLSSILDISSERRKILEFLSNYVFIEQSEIAYMIQR